MMAAKSAVPSPAVKPASEIQISKDIYSMEEALDQQANSTPINQEMLILLHKPKRYCELLNSH